jgi:hypothetical protein
MAVTLLDEVKLLCDRISPLGWRSILKRVTNGALDIIQPNASQLRTSLTAKLPSVDRTVPGFEDFNPAGDQAIVAGKPSESLLYHALASPLVTRDEQGRLLQGHATPAELDALENFIFSLSSISLAQFIQQNGGASKISLVIFAIEYRPASSTVDGCHADLTFSRTGIARVGTSHVRYDPATRGCWPEDEDNPHNIRVIPARFSAWLSVKRKGRDVRVSPILDNDQARGSGEANRNFWVPVHKVFAGSECLRGLTLTPHFTAKLFNLKIQRIHKALKTVPLPTDFPYVITDSDIADWSADPNFGPGWLVPTPHSRLVEPAIVNGKPITYKVTAKVVDDFAGIELPGKGVFNNMEINPAPSYVHGRTKVQNGRMHDLNDERDVIKTMKASPYEALHYVDFTGEGWVEISFPELATHNVVSQPAYALVCAPDFFPSSGQFELSEWSRSSEVPSQFRGKLWHVSPTPLSETRLPANLQLPSSPFSASDTTITAVVGMGTPVALPPMWPRQADVLRSSYLPDDAAGVFAPGWDAAVDRLPGNGKVAHLAGYGLGSPFPEDAKLCAALSTFWPAVAPDVFRTFATPVGNTSGTIAPLTDEEIGQAGSLSWDGIPGPRIVDENGQRFVELARFLHIDYVRQAVQSRFSIRLTSRISSEEYRARILAINRVYSVVANLGDISVLRDDVLALSFRKIPFGDPELQRAQTHAGTILNGEVYRIDLCDNVQTEGKPLPSDPRLQRFPLQNLQFFFASAESRLVLTKRESDSRWAAASSEV